MPDKKTKIIYTPEEQAEIDRIIGIVTGEEIEPEEITPAPKPVPDVAEIEIDDAGFDDIEAFDIEDEHEPILDDESFTSEGDFQETDLFDLGADEIPGIDESEIIDITDEEEILPLSDTDLSFIEDEASSVEEDFTDTLPDREPEDLDILGSLDDISDIDLEADPR